MAMEYACNPCKRRKRKCNKDPRGCSTCANLGSRCSYAASAPTASSTKSRPRPTDSTVSFSITPQPLHLDDEASVLRSRPALLCLSSKSCYEFRRNVLDLIEAPASVKRTAEKYFASIHTWLPVISQDRLFRSLSQQEHHSYVPALSAALLQLAMRLIISIPYDMETGDLNLNLYRSIKRLLLASELECEPSLELVQAWLLMAVFEMGHDIGKGAFLSIGTCARLAMLLGLHRSHDRSHGKGLTWVEMEERNRVWWGIVIVERYINLICLGSPTSFITRDPVSSDALPIEDEVWDEAKLVEYPEPLPLSTAASVRLGAFAREAQVASLLGRATMHVCNPTADFVFNAEESEQLDRTLSSFLTTLPAEDVIKPCTAYCAAMGICCSARLLLHTPSTKPLSSQPPLLLEAVLDSVEFVHHRSVKYTSNIETVDVDSLTPFVPYALFQAALVHLSRADDSSAATNILLGYRLRLLREMLASYGQRWRFARQLLERLRHIEEGRRYTESERFKQGA